MPEMDTLRLPAEGGCRCGKVRFRVTAPPLFTSACHCRGCQKMTGGPYSLSVAIPSEGFEVTEGEPVIGGMHAEPQHFFCGWCMSWLFTRIPGVDFFVNVRAPMLDHADWAVPFIETCTSEALPWALTGARYAYPGFPPMEDLGAILAAYRSATDG